MTDATFTGGVWTLTPIGPFGYPTSSIVAGGHIVTLVGTAEPGSNLVQLTGP